MAILPPIAELPVPVILSTPLAVTLLTAKFPFRSNLQMLARMMSRYLDGIQIARGILKIGRVVPRVAREPSPKFVLAPAASIAPVPPLATDSCVPDQLELLTELAVAREPRPREVLPVNAVSPVAPPSHLFLSLYAVFQFPDDPM